MKIKEGNVLTKVTHYRLQRNELGSINIELHEFLSEGADYKFAAFPKQIIPTAQIKDELVIYGNSASEVLELLINKIQDLKSEEIFPKKEVVR